MNMRYVLASIASPDINRAIEKAVRLSVKMVENSPRKPHQFAKIMALTLPILSPSNPKIIVPKIEPTKNRDSPTGVL